MSILSQIVDFDCLQWRYKGQSFVKIFKNVSPKLCNKRDEADILPTC